jgi:hypothetical protein
MAKHNPDRNNFYEIEWTLESTTRSIEKVFLILNMKSRQVKKFGIVPSLMHFSRTIVTLYKQPSPTNSNCKRIPL